MIVVIFSTVAASVTAFSCITEDFTTFGMNTELKCVPQIYDHGEEDMDSIANKVNSIKHWDVVLQMALLVY